MKMFADPFKKVKRGRRVYYKGPSGREFNKKQLIRYYARGGRFDNAFYCVDAQLQFDPTATFALRRSARASLEMRWRKVRGLLQQAVVREDMLRLSGRTASQAALTASFITSAISGVSGHTSDAKIKAFQTWFDQTLLAVVLERTGGFLDPVIARAYAKGIDRGQKLTRSTVVPENQDDTIASLKQLAFAELQGIVEAVSQRVVREISLGLLHSDLPRKVYQRAAEAIDKVGIVRSRAMIDQMVVKTFNQALLTQMAAHGVKRVGLVPESVPPSKLRRDAEGPGSRVARNVLPSESTIARIVKATLRLEELGEVEIVTAGDNDVCEECEGLEDGGPYDIATAMSLIPAHPHCRCTFVPTNE